MGNILNKVIEIEDYYGNTIMAIEVDEKGNIKQFKNCNIADEDLDYIFDTDKTLIRLQADDEI